MHVSSNELVRSADRLESVLLAVLSLMGLLGVLVALTMGSDAYARNKVVVENQPPRHAVIAKVVGTPKQDNDTSFVVWSERDGRQITAAVGRERQDRVGGTRKIWLAPDGEVVDRPATTADAMLHAFATGGRAVIVTALGWWLLTWLVRAITDRYRAQRWEAEWCRFDIDSHH
ncbi:Rv1733c family protein [Gordonia amicalis]|uniref:Rv1733c family protein n=2 Tax=Gordoniaceae TaxID=85026 RepID=UPI002953EA5C|nr:hypothetical protein [Gordonia amicalis]MDV7077622.1 hypothetical protein [Gordonia amicalis]